MHLDTTRVLALLLGVLLGTAGSARAQFTQGDLILTSIGPGAGQGLFRIDRSGGALEPMNALSKLNAVHMGFDNRWAYACALATPSIVYQVTRDGALQQVSFFPDGVRPDAMAPDQDGSVLVASAGPRGDGIYRFVPHERPVFFAPVASANAICRDLTTGNFLVGQVSTGSLVRLDRVTGGRQIVATGLGSISGLAYIPSSGRFAVTRLSSPTGLLLVTSTGAVWRSVPVSGANAVTVDGKQDLIHVAGHAGRTGYVTEVSSSGTVLRTRAYGTSHFFSGLDVWGDRNVSVYVNELQGVADIHLRFDRSRGRPYCVGLAMGMRPGVRFSPRNRLQLAPDALLFLTCGRDLPGVSTGFAGTTSTFSGRAFARFRFAPGLPTGLCVYVGAVVFNPALPQNLDVSNVECVRIP